MCSWEAATRIDWELEVQKGLCFSNSKGNDWMIYFSSSHQYYAWLIHLTVYGICFIYYLKRYTGSIESRHTCTIKGPAKLRSQTSIKKIMIPSFSILKPLRYLAAISKQCPRIDTIAHITTWNGKAHDPPLRCKGPNAADSSWTWRNNET